MQSGRPNIKHRKTKNKPQGGNILSDAPALFISHTNGKLHYITYQKSKHDDHQYTTNPHTLF